MKYPGMIFLAGVITWAHLPVPYFQGKKLLPISGFGLSAPITFTPLTKITTFDGVAAINERFHFLKTQIPGCRIAR
jgi:hypothetical protein